MESFIKLVPPGVGDSHPTIMYMRLKAEEGKYIKFIGLKFVAVARKSLRWMLGLFSNVCIKG